ncbi:hypothetical protein I7I51_02155 [Histoplasma capsulatum]|uniref:Uncharacterized protein n=1 Tax=Ajellomyces capsulatus TaxID=5037 RepID=A0A8A1M7D7_AJECA|nr:hypothetical protein I7I51_02155 [Histoplasma capsulatum]
MASCAKVSVAASVRNRLGDHVVIFLGVRVANLRIYLASPPHLQGFSCLVISSSRGVKQHQMIQDTERCKFSAFESGAPGCTLHIGLCCVAPAHLPEASRIPTAI